MYARPQGSTLGVSGMLWRDALIMYDRASRSLWSQVNGRAVAGPLKGQRLAELPSQLTTWGQWKRRHPETLVMVKPSLSGSPYEDYFLDPERIGVRGSTNPDRRLGGKTLVLGLEVDGRFAAAPLSTIENRGVLNAETAGTSIVVTTAGAFGRAVANRTLSFDRVDATRMRDRETASTWSVESGEAIDGPLRGTRLPRLSAKVVYWGVWARFHPRAELIR